MIADGFPDSPAGRPAWLITLADLALLLVGFFVFLQASQHLDRQALARGLRGGFGAPAEPAPIEPMPVAAAALRGFARGSAVLPYAPAALTAWARNAARDPRVRLKITGQVDGTADDVDRDTGSGALLAADRARAVAAALLRAGAAAPERITIVNAAASRHGARGVLVTLGFAGELK